MIHIIQIQFEIFILKDDPFWMALDKTEALQIFFFFDKQQGLLSYEKQMYFLLAENIILSD